MKIKEMVFFLFVLFLLFYCIAFGEEQNPYTINNISCGRTTGYIETYSGYTPDNSEITIFVLSFDYENYYAVFLCDFSINEITSDDLFVSRDRGNSILFEKLDDSNGKKAFLDKDTGFFSQFIYDAIVPLSDDVMAVLMEETYYFIDIHTGSIIYSFEEGDQLTDVCYFSNGYSCINNFKKRSLKIICRDGKQIEIKNVFAVYPVSEEGYLVTVNYDSSLYGVYSVNGNIIVDNTWIKILKISNGKAFMKDSSGMWGIISANKILLPCSLDLKEPVTASFDGKYTIVKTNNDDWIIISDDGTIETSITLPADGCAIGDNM